MELLKDSVLSAGCKTRGTERFILSGTRVGEGGSRLNRTVPSALPCPTGYTQLAVSEFGGLDCRPGASPKVPPALLGDDSSPQRCWVPAPA